MTPQERAGRRLVQAVEEVYAAAHALGLDPEALYTAQAPFAMRCDTWLWKTHLLLGCQAPEEREVAA